MAARKGIIQLSRGDIAVAAKFETERMEEHELEEAPEIFMWDKQADQPVVRERYAKAAHEEVEDEPALPKGTVGYRYVNEDGEKVPSERIVYLQRTPDGDRERVQKRPSTVIKDEILPVEKWVDHEDVEDFLVESTYEVWGRDEEDVVELQRLAEYIEERGEAPMFVWMLQPDFFKTWGILVPRFDEDAHEFSLIVQVTRKKIEPAHEMPILTQKEIQELREAAEAGFVAQEAPG